MTHQPNKHFNTYKEGLDLKAHEDYNCLLITYDDEGTEEGIPVVPVCIKN